MFVQYEMVIIKIGIFAGRRAKWRRGRNEFNVAAARVQRGPTAVIRPHYTVMRVESGKLL